MPLSVISQVQTKNSLRAVAAAGLARGKCIYLRFGILASAGNLIFSSGIQGGARKCGSGTIAWCDIPGLWIVCWLFHEAGPSWRSAENALKSEKM